MKEITLDGKKYRLLEEASEEVLVRTYSAGVHIGTLEIRDGKEVKLTNARILHRWRGANTLREVATEGVVTDSYTKISKPVPEVILTEAIEIMPVSKKASKTLEPIWNS